MYIICCTQREASSQQSQNTHTTLSIFHQVALRDHHDSHCKASHQIRADLSESQRRSPFLAWQHSIHEHVWLTSTAQVTGVAMGKNKQFPVWWGEKQTCLASLNANNAIGSYANLFGRTATLQKLLVFLCQQTKSSTVHHFSLVKCPVHSKSQKW